LTAEPRWTTAGRIGRPHGLDGSFHVEHASHPLPEGAPVRFGDRESEVARRAGSAERPLVRVAGVEDRDAAAALRGQTLLVRDESELEPGEYLVKDLVGCMVEGLGEVRGVIAAPSCDLLEVGEDRVLVPLISDAVKRVDLESRTIAVDRGFLGLEDGQP
jgi:16S rRNA processing protein RimM